MKPLLSGMPPSSVEFDNQDPVLRSIAQELHRTLNQDGIPNASLQGTQEYDFRLQSLLTRPRNCSTLFPPRVLKERHQTITLQERLILISVKPVEDPTTTATTTTSASSASNISASKPIDPTASSTSSAAVLVAGLEVLEYTLSSIQDAASDSISSSRRSNTGSPQQPTPPRQERIVYIAKVDTSGCWPLPGLETQSLKSPAQALVRGYLRAMRAQGAECGTGNIPAADQMSSLSLSPSTTTDEPHPMQGQGQDRTHVSKTSLFVFARAQPQYLFAESAKHSGKRVLDDRGLVRWWKNMITSAYSEPSSSLSSPSSSSSSSSSQSSLPCKIQGWWLIPGIESERQAMNVIQSKTPSRTPATTTTTTTTTITAGAPSLTPLALQYGYSDKDSKEMAQTLIPQFPDDPKSRMLKSPSCQGGFVDIKTFWELAAIGEESGAGKITGFFKVIEDVHTPPAAVSSSIIIASEKKPTPKMASSAFMTATGSTSDYTRAINFLLELNFSTQERAQDSTRQWFDRLEIWINKAALRNAEVVDTQASDDAVNDAPCQTTTEGEQPKLEGTDDSKTRSTETTTPVDRRTSAARPLWIQQGTVRIPLRRAQDTSASGSVPAAAAATAGAVVHTLNPSLIKRKPPQQQQQQNALPPSTSSDVTSTVPAVNVLGANLIKRKPAATSATTTTTTAGAAVASVTPAVTSDAATSSEPTVTILGSHLIKKRKLDP
ncbi:unnamed protein product [Mortierella alpina]